MLGMSDVVTSALLGALTTLILAGGSGLRWWIQRRDEQRRAQAAEAALDETERQALETVEQLRDENAELREDNEELREALTRVLLELGGGGRRG